MRETAYMWHGLGAFLVGLVLGMTVRRRIQQRRVSDADKELAENARRKAQQLRTELERRGGYRGS